MTEKMQQRILSLFFDEGLEPAEIARRTRVKAENVAKVLSDEALLSPFRGRMEAARLRAQLVVAGSAETAARVQQSLLSEGGSVGQRAAKDILDRAGVGPKKADPGIRVIFTGAPFSLGMPKGIGDEPPSP